MQKRRATVLRLRPEPSVRETPEPTVRFQIEPFYVIAPELPALFRRHYRELGRNRDVVPLDPDWNAFMRQAMNNNLIILTAREIATSKLIGYVFNLVGSHTHYRTTPHAVVDMYYLEREFRVGWTGYKMLKQDIAEMKKLGIVRMNIGENLLFTKSSNNRIRLIMRRLGFKPVDVQYSQILVE